MQTAQSLDEVIMLTIHLSLQGRAVQTAQSLDEGLRVMVPLRTTELAFDNNNGRLVFLQGMLHTDEVIVMMMMMMMMMVMNYSWCHPMQSPQHLTVTAFLTMTSKHYCYCCTHKNSVKKDMQREREVWCNMQNPN